MHTQGLQLSVAAIAFANFFLPIASRPVVEDGTSDILPREADANNGLACRQAVEEVTSIVTVTVLATTTESGGTATSTVAVVNPVGNVDIANGGQALLSTSTSILGAQTVKSTFQAAQTTSVSSSTSNEIGGPCTSGDPLSDLGFHITNAGSVAATYYFYASYLAENTSEMVHYKCAEIGSQQTIWVSIIPGLNGRIMRGLPYSQTPGDHRARGPASWFEFNHNITTNEIWGDVSLIQGYDGPILFKGSDGLHGFSTTLPMPTVSASYPAALVTKTAYPSDIPPPTVIAPTTSTAIEIADGQAYDFYSEGYPNGPCGNLQDTTYASNNPQFNPSFVTENQQYSITFYEGIL